MEVLTVGRESAAAFAARAVSAGTAAAAAPIAIVRVVRVTAELSLVGSAAVAAADADVFLFNVVIHIDVFAH